MMCMKIGFLLVGQNSPNEGVIRPFIGWVKGQSNLVQTYVYLLRCGGQVKKAFVSAGGKVFCCNKISELIDNIKSSDISILIGDDDYSRLKVLDYVKKKTGVKTAVYVQVLYGSHSISRVFSSNSLTLDEKIKFKLSSLIPFKLLTQNYTRMLKRQNIVIANSKITAALLALLYDVGVDGIVYPPVDIEVFRPKRRDKRLSSVVVYLGSHAGDTNVKFIREITHVVKKSNFDLYAFGNRLVANQLDRWNCKLSYCPHLSDNELADLYEKSILTICPQKWETFGYVPIESMACGTPVLIFDHYIGASETIIKGKTGWLAKNEEEFLRIMNSILKAKKIKVNRHFIVKYAETNFSIDKSVKKLKEILANRGIA